MKHDGWSKSSIHYLNLVASYMLDGEVVTRLLSVSPMLFEDIVEEDDDNNDDDYRTALILAFILYDVFFISLNCFFERENRFPSTEKISNHDHMMKIHSKFKTNIIILLSIVKICVVHIFIFKFL